MHCAIECLAGKRLVMQRTIVVAIKETSKLIFQFLHPRDRGLTQAHRHILIWQPLATIDGIHEMTFHRVTGRQGNVVATLHHARATTFTEQTLNCNSDMEVWIGLARVQSREQAGTSTTED